MGGDRRWEILKGGRREERPRGPRGMKGAKGREGSGGYGGYGGGRVPEEMWKDELGHGEGQGKCMCNLAFREVGHDSMHFLWGSSRLSCFQKLILTRGIKRTFLCYWRCHIKD